MTDYKHTADWYKSLFTKEGLFRVERDTMSHNFPKGATVVVTEGRSTGRPSARPYGRSVVSSWGSLAMEENLYYLRRLYRAHSTQAALTRPLENGGRSESQCMYLYEGDPDDYIYRFFSSDDLVPVFIIGETYRVDVVKSTDAADFKRGDLVRAVGLNERWAAQSAILGIGDNASCLVERISDGQRAWVGPGEISLVPPVEPAMEQVSPASATVVESEEEASSSEAVTLGEAETMGEESVDRKSLRCYGVFLNGKLIVALPKREEARRLKSLLGGSQNGARIYRLAQAEEIR